MTRKILLATITALLCGLLTAGGATAAARLEAQNGWQTQQPILMGSQAMQITNSKVQSDDKSFGPPVTEATPRQGHCSLLTQVGIGADSDREWKDAVGSLTLRDAAGKSYRLSLWYFNGCYRPSLFLDMADGQGVAAFPSTTLAFHMPKPLPKGLALMAGDKRLAGVGELLKRTASSGSGIPGASLKAQGITAYCLVKGASIKTKPAFDKTAKEIASLGFGESVTTTGRTDGDWVNVTRAKPKAAGWVHRAALTLDKALIAKAKAAGAIPKSLIFISKITSPSEFNVAIVAGSVRVGNKRLLADHGTSLMVGHTGLDAARAGVSVKGLGVDQTLSNLEPWRLYFFSTGSHTFLAWDQLTASGRKVARGKPIPSEKAVVGTSNKKPDNWPVLAATVSGSNPVRVVNPNEYDVKVAIRQGRQGCDFMVKAKSQGTANLPNGRCDIYFRYSNDPEGLYQGDSFTLQNNGVEIRLVKIAQGNYGVRKVK